MTTCKNDDRSPHQKSKFFIASKGVVLSLAFDPGEKRQNIYYRIYACF